MYGFKLTKPTGVELPIGRLFRLDASGQEEPLWERTLVSTPGAVFISDDLRTVATVNGSCESDKKHALVLYGADGRVVADHTFDDIVPEKQWAGRVAVTYDGISWVEATQFRFDSSRPLENHFVITFPGRIQIRIDRTTGRVVAGDGVEVKPSPR